MRYPALILVFLFLLFAPVFSIEVTPGDVPATGDQAVIDQLINQRLLSIDGKLTAIQTGAIKPEDFTVFKRDVQRQVRADMQFFLLGVVVSNICTAALMAAIYFLLKSMRRV